MEFEPKDVIAILTIIMCGVLLRVGIDGPVKGIFVAVALHYFSTRAADLARAIKRNKK